MPHGIQRKALAVRLRRWSRLVDTGEGSRQPLIPVAVFAGLIMAFLLSVPWGLEHVDETRRFLDPSAKRAYLLLAAGVGIALVVASIMVFMTGVGALGVLYGRQGGPGQPLTLASPLGCIGMPSRRIQVLTGDAEIRVVVHPPRSPAYSYGKREVAIRQGDRELHVSSVVHFRHGSRQRLLELLEQAGVRVEFTGDIGALP